MVIEQDIVTENVRQALKEDIGGGDVTAPLIPKHTLATAGITLREDAVLSGGPWFEEVFKQLDPSITIEWHASESGHIKAGQLICRLTGPARSLLSGERCALNFLQTLSGTATTVARYVELIRETNTILLDSRKTLPGLRYAQKYAVRCGGGTNHRMGLYDGMLIKENHIAITGSIANALHTAKAYHGKIEVEVESLAELEQALAENVEQILLDNFDLAMLSGAVKMANGKTRLEASGNIDSTNILAVANTGVDYISIGALTKHVRAIDFSMRIEFEKT